MPTPNITKLFEPLQLTTGATTIYTSTGVILNGRLSLLNATAGAITVTLYAVPASGAASDTNAFMKDESIAAKTRLVVDFPELKAGDLLQGLASSAASISVHALGGVPYQ